MDKKNNIGICILVFLGIGLIFNPSCKKESNSDEFDIVVTTTEPGNITKIAAVSGGNITANAGLVISGRGVCWTNKKPPVSKPLTTINCLSLTSDGTGTGEFTSLLDTLKSGTVYYIRAYADYFVESDTSPIIKTSYGKLLSFTTSKEDVNTTAVISRSDDSATCSSIVTNPLSASVARGLCWSADSIPDLGDSKTIDGMGPGVFESIITPLLPDTKYFVRAYALSDADTSYGNDFVVQTLGLPVSDGDGNNYNIVRIENQVWMISNLKTTKYINGTPIPGISKNEEWNTMKTPAFCWYNNDPAKYKNTYGALYNWYAIETDRLCPLGWRIPSETDWNVLTAILDGESFAGGNLKESGTIHWISPNNDANNETGFTALPGGGRNYAGFFDGIQKYGYFWSSTEDPANTEQAWFRYLNYEDGTLTPAGLDKRTGVSVRCIKD